MVIVCEESVKKKLKNGKIRCGYFMDDMLKANLDYEIKRVNKNWDAVILYDGEEGSAKTTLACANANYMSEQCGVKFDINNIVFTQTEFMRLVDVAKPYTNIVWDEFVLSGLNLEALTMLQITLIKKMTIIRKKRLIIHLIIPYMFMLTKYFAIARTRCLIHVYSVDNLNRGDFLYFSKPKKRMLYIKGKKFWEYNTKADFNGKFTDTYGLLFDEEEYERRKDEATQKITHDNRQTKAGESVCRGILWLQKNLGYTQDKVAEVFGWDGGHKSVEYFLKKYAKDVISYQNTKESGVLRREGSGNNYTNGDSTKLIVVSQQKEGLNEENNDQFEEELSDEPDEEEAKDFKSVHKKQNIFDFG